MLKSLIKPVDQLNWQERCLSSVIISYHTADCSVWLWVQLIYYFCHHIIPWSKQETSYTGVSISSMSPRVGDAVMPLPISLSLLLKHRTLNFILYELYTGWQRRQSFDKLKCDRLFSFQRLGFGKKRELEILGRLLLFRHFCFPFSNIQLESVKHNPAQRALAAARYNKKRDSKKKRTWTYGHVRSELT